MNKIYKVIWSKVKNSYVVTSELAKSYTKSPKTTVFSSSFVAGVLACVLSCGAVLPVYASSDGTELGTYSIANGEYSIATGIKSTAIGYGAVATGDNMTRESIESTLANNKQIQETINANRVVYQQQLNAYNNANTAFQSANEIYLKVQNQDTQNAQWQSQIDTTLQPNATTAANAYNTAKSEYDTVFNDFSDRLSRFELLDFSQFSNGDGTYNLDNMASYLKSDVESGTNLNYDVSFYRNYIDNYIVRAEKRRILAEDASNFSYVGSVNNNAPLHNGFTYYKGGHLSLSTSSIAQKLASKVGSNLYNSLLASDANAFKVRRVDNILNPGVSKVSYDDITFGEGNNDANFSTLLNYSFYDVADLLNRAMTNEEKDRAITNIDNMASDYLKVMNNLCDVYIDAGYYTASEKEKFVKLFRDQYTADGNIYKWSVLAANAQYNLEQTNDLQYLTLKNNYISQIRDLLASGATSYKSANLVLDSNGAYSLKFNESTAPYSVNFFTSYYGDKYTNFIAERNYDGVTLFQNISKDLYENYTEVVSVAASVLEEMRNGLDGTIGEKRTAMEEALAAKNAADNELASIQRKIANNQPTASERAQAETVATKAQQLEQQRLKLEADEQALEDAKAQLDNLVDLKDLGMNAIAIGTDALTTGTDAIGIGTNAIVTGQNAVGVGKNVIVSGENAVGIGVSNTVSSQNGLAIGSSNAVSGTNSIALGNNNVVSGNNSIAIGNSLHVIEDNVVSIGNRKMTNVATGTADTDAVNVKQLNDAISDINIDANGQVVRDNTGLVNGGVIFNEVRSSNGNYVQASKSAGENINLLDTALKSLDISAIKYANEDHSLATFDATNGTKLSNLKAGAISASSMDAINGSQLYAVKQDITGFASDIAKNSENIRTMNASVTSALSSVAASGLLVDTMDVSKADASLNNLTEGGKQILRQYATTAVQEYMAAQQSNSSAPMAPMVAGSNTLSVTDAGNGSLHVGEGSSVTGSSSIAIGVGNQVNANNSGAFGDPSIINADESYVLGNDDTVNAGATGSFIVGNNGESSAQGALLFGSNTKASSDAVDGVSIGNRSKVSAQNSIALGSDSIADTEGVLSIGNTTMKRKIVHVADGDVSSGSDEVVTGNQLFTLSERVDKNASDLLKKADISYVDEGLSLKADKTSVYTKKQMDEQLGTKANVDASNINSSDWATKLGTGKVLPGDNNLVTGDTVFGALYQYDASNNLVRSTDGIITIGKADMGRMIDVTNASGETRVITGVATNPQDEFSAANVGYVNSVGTSLMEKMNTGLSRIESKTNKLGAGAAAMSALMPAPMDGDEKWSFSAAVGNYRSETAAAVGAFFKPQDNVIVNVRGTVGNEENMVGAGVSVALNRGNTPQVSKAQLVRKMQDMETNHRQVVAQQNSVIQTLQQEVAIMKEELKALKESK